jgi:phage baseplate assembly protein W
LVTREREIEESIRLVLATRPGSGRCGRVRLRRARLRLRPADAATAGDIAYAVRVALERWEPRIDLHDVVVRFDAVAGRLLSSTCGTPSRHQRPAQPGLPVLRHPRSDEGGA